MDEGVRIFTRCAIIIIVLFHLCAGYSYFQDLIPNGDKVPNPCRPDERWIGVGHKNINGNGARNPFGLDLADQGRAWTKELCEKDSDLDGRTNGQELGDPNCTWTSGMPSPTGNAISHPGICEPWTDPKCLGKGQSWVRDQCQPSEFKCDGIESAEVQNITLRIPRLPVPSRETTYMCQIFSVPQDTDYHFIAATPIIDNVNVLHHMTLFGCDEGAPESPAPFHCGMIAHKNCQSIVALWGPGRAGICVHPSVGFRMGASGFKKIALQVHWNNPELRGDYFDQSGMTMYFTSTLRDNDAGILTTGQIELLIPPGESLVSAEAIYPGDCTQREFSGNIYITSAVNHMHYLGFHHYLELYREGVKIRDIAIDLYYNYDNPQVHTFAKPLEVRPGDELRTRCVYSSTRLNHTTMFGWATSDEMCFSFITYYPKHNAMRQLAISHISVPYCRYEAQDIYEGCPHKTFPDLSDPNILKRSTDITTNCKLFAPCTQSCYEAVQAAKEHKCLQGDVWKIVIDRFVKSVESVEFLMRLRSCDCGVPPTPPTSVAPITKELSKCDWPRLLTSGPDHPLYLLYVNINSKCIATGPCLKECILAVRVVRAHSCFQGGEWEYGRRFLHQSQNITVLEFLLAFESCNCQIEEEDKRATTTPSGTEPPTTVTAGAASNINGFYSVFLIHCFCFITIRLSLSF